MSVAELKGALEQMRLNGESGRTLGQIQDRIQAYATRISQIAERPRDEMGFDLADMGVDYLFVDESQEFKNLEYVTGGERVVGMNDPKGSKKAFDLYVKMRGIRARKGGVAFATGTPVSNSLVELYTVLSYLGHEDLVSRGLSNFDAWSGSFAVTETKLEYTATQKLKPRRVLSALTNLRSLGQMYEHFADVITLDTLKKMHAEDVTAENKRTGASRRTSFPVPKVKSGGRQLQMGKITAQQAEFMDYLVSRMQAIQDNARDREYIKIDNALWVLTDARKMSLDIRAVDPQADRDEDGKVMRAARNIKATYDRWADDRGTQLVFSDLSTPAKGAVKAADTLLSKAATVLFQGKSKQEMEAVADQTRQDKWRWIEDRRDEILSDPETTEARRDAIEEHFAEIEDAQAAMLVADTGFSVYDDLRDVLSDMGIPRAEIAFIHEYNTPEQKDKLFRQVNAGVIRVLVGSWAKMGAGTNAQERLVALHHLDAPWRPSDVEQREGRIIRQGNKLYERDPDGFEVDIIAYSTEGTSDTVMWQILQRKAAPIEQFREGGLDAMEEDGADSDQYAEFMASSTGNPVFRLELEASRRTTDLSAQLGGRRIAKVNAESFVKNFDRRRSRYAKIADGAAKAKVCTAPGS
ncbi:hypothetical protein [Amaricoccus sp. W119]|uniref:hypothetical protein n=1 Tax=Amaricoccus sp. W119 TaxID=3391833 RepID=UPI0039A5CA44